MKIVKLFPLLLLATVATSPAQTFINTFDTTPVLSGTGAGTGPVPGAWYVDRYAPATFTNISFMGNMVLDAGVSASDFNLPPPLDLTYFNTQGRAYGLTDSGTGTSISAQLYVSSSWQTIQVAPGLWSTADDPTHTPSLAKFGIVGFYSDGAGSSYFRVYDDTLGDYVQVATPVTWDSWYTFQLTLTPDGVVYSIDGTDVYTNTGAAGSVSLSNVIFNSRNYGSSYDAYWDNLTTPSSTVPEPKSVILLALGGIALLGMRKSLGIGGRAQKACRPALV